MSRQRRSREISFYIPAISHTKFGHIKGLSADELAVLLDKEQTVIELQLKSK